MLTIHCTTDQEVDSAWRRLVEEARPGEPPTTLISAPWMPPIAVLRDEQGGLWVEQWGWPGGGASRPGSAT